MYILCINFDELGGISGEYVLSCLDSCGHRLLLYSISSICTQKPKIHLTVSYMESERGPCGHERLESSLIYLELAFCAWRNYICKTLFVRTGTFLTVVYFPASGALGQEVCPLTNFVISDALGVDIVQDFDFEPCLTLPEILPQIDITFSVPQLLSSSDSLPARYEFDVNIDAEVR